MVLSATPSKLILYPGCSQALKLEGLFDELSQTFLNAATVKGTLLDDNGNEVSGCIGVVFTYTPASNGDYVGIFGDINFQPQVGTGYTLLVEATQSTSTLQVSKIVEIQPRQT